MILNDEIESKLRKFIDRSSFASHGVVVTDLDGTAVHEFELNEPLRATITSALPSSGSD